MPPANHYSKGDMKISSDFSSKILSEERTTIIEPHCEKQTGVCFVQTF